MPRCPAKPWGPGGPSGPCRDTERGDQTQRGGGTALNEDGGMCPPKTYRRAVLAGFTFLTRGASGALETRVTGTARGTSITTSTLGTIFASRARGTGGAWVTLRGEKMGLVQTEAAFLPSSPASWHRSGAPGWLLCLKTLRNKTFYGLVSCPVPAGGCLAQGPSATWPPARSKQHLPSPQPQWWAIPGAPE